MKQSAKQRRALSSNDFAIPGQGARRGKYPIQDQAHAIAALAKVDAEGTPEEKRKVHAAVRKRYPNLPAGPRPDEQPSFPADQTQVPAPRSESGRTPSKTF